MIAISLRRALLFAASLSDVLHSSTDLTSACFFSERDAWLTWSLHLS